MDQEYAPPPAGDGGKWVRGIAATAVIVGSLGVGGIALLLVVMASAFASPSADAAMVAAVFAVLAVTVGFTLLGIAILETELRRAFAVSGGGLLGVGVLLAIGVRLVLS